MKYQLIYIMLLFSVAVAGQTVTEVFQSMPSELLPGVSEGNKTMLLVDTNSTSVPATLGVITKINHRNDFLHVRTSEAGDTQIKLLPVASDSVIVCLVQTVCAGACDSRISFYTTQWQELDAANYLPEISKEAFFISSKKNSDNYKYAVSLLHISSISALFAEEGTNLVLRLHYAEWLTNKQMQEIKPFLQGDTILLKWNKDSFRYQ